MNESLNEEDKSLLMEALRYHPKREEKVGAGVQDIKVIAELVFARLYCSS
jgi:DNA-directed RNA polymerase IV subunit 1